MAMHSAQRNRALAAGYGRAQIAQPCADLSGSARAQLQGITADGRDVAVGRACAGQDFIRALSEPMWKPLICGLGIYSGTALGSCTI